MARPVFGTAVLSERLSERVLSRLAEVLVCCGVLALFYGVITVAGTWLGPFTPAAAISRSPAALPLYAAYSLPERAGRHYLRAVTPRASGRCPHSARR